MASGICGSCGSSVGYNSSSCPMCGNSLSMTNNVQTYQQPGAQMHTMVSSGEKKDVGIAYLLHIILPFIGFLGIHRIYCGYTGSGILMLVGWWFSIVLSFLIIGLIPLFMLTIWWVVDFFLIPGMCEPKQQINHVMQYQMPPPPQY